MSSVRCASFGLAIVALAAASSCLPMALACSCLAPPPPAQALQQSAGVFLGKVVSIEENQPAPSLKTVTLTVEKWWKGGEAASVKVITSGNGASCGFGFQKDGRYLVYAYAQKANEPWNASLCSRTAEAKNAQATGDFEALGPGTPPKGKS